MADNQQKKRIPLLFDELSEVERMNLTSMTQHPGYPVLEKLFMALCQRANAEVIALDQTEEGFERKFRPLQQRSRDFNEASVTILNSVEWHKQLLENTEAERSEVQKPENPILGKGLKNTNV